MPLVIPRATYEWECYRPWEAVSGAAWVLISTRVEEEAFLLCASTPGCYASTRVEEA